MASVSYPLQVEETGTTSTEAEEYVKYGKPMVDPDRIANEIADIKRRLSTIFEDGDAEKHFILQSMEVQLAIGVEGGVWFVAKGTAEASLKLVFGRS